MKRILEDKVAIITGASRGLGQAFALRFAREGAKLLLTTTNLNKAEETLKKINEFGGTAFVVEMDLKNEDSVKNMADTVIKRFGKIDILVNNAAIWHGLNAKPWDSWSITEWDHMFDVNVKGTWLCCKTIVPLMKKDSHGRIINIVSTIIKSAPASQYFLAYACSKSSVYNITIALSSALGPLGITVNGIAPGFTATEASMNMQGSEDIFKNTISAQSIKRREEPVDLVGTAAFLASNDADFITGQVIYVDGGLTIL